MLLRQLRFMHALRNTYTIQQDPKSYYTNINSKNNIEF